MSAHLRVCVLVLAEKICGRARRPCPEPSCFVGGERVLDAFGDGEAEQIIGRGHRNRASEGTPDNQLVWTGIGLAATVRLEQREMHRVNVEWLAYNARFWLIANSESCDHRGVVL